MTADILAMPLRERQRLQTRRAIAAAAFELAEERGVSGVTVHDIAAAAGVSHRTFFNHFGSKEEALVPDLQPFPDDLVSEFLDPEDDSDLLAALERLVTKDLARRQADAPLGADQLARRMRLIASNRELLPRMLRVFEDGYVRLRDLVAQRTGRPSSDLSCQVAAKVAMSTTRTALQAAAASGSSDIDLEVVGRAFAALRQLVGAAPFIDPVQETP